MKNGCTFSTLHTLYKYIPAGQICVTTLVLLLSYYLIAMAWHMGIGLLRSMFLDGLYDCWLFFGCVDILSSVDKPFFRKQLYLRA